VNGSAQPVIVHVIYSAQGGRKAGPLIKETILLQAINLARKLDSFSDHWALPVAATMNDYEVVRVEGEFVWRSHSDATTCSWCWTANSISNYVTRRGDAQTGRAVRHAQGVEHRPAARRARLE
jgi:hypothetical protein